MMDSRIQDAALLLRECPGEWAVVAKWDLPSNLFESAGVCAEAVSIAAQFRNGRGDVFQRPGGFDVGVVHVGEEDVRLYVRFVSESTVGADVLDSSGFLGDRLPRPIPLVLADVGVVYQDPAFGEHLIDPGAGSVWISFLVSKFLRLLVG